MQNKFKKKKKIAQVCNRGRVVRLSHYYKYVNDKNSMALMVWAVFEKVHSKN